MTPAASLPTPFRPDDPSPVMALLRERLQADHGWMPVDAFMALALYEPGLGYYSRRGDQIGLLPARTGADGDGSDFATAPVISPLFGRALAEQVAQALQATGTTGVWEFGAGTGALAAQLLAALRDRGLAVDYHIVDLSGGLQAAQRGRLAPWAPAVQWHDRLPDVVDGVVVGNEVLDALPVKLLARLDGVWHERGVTLDATGALSVADRRTDLRPPVEPPGTHDYVTEIHPQAEAFVRTLAERHRRGLAVFIDYGFPEAEYYHPERHMGTFMAHRQHRSSADWLAQPGEWDLTAHVNFTSVALAAQEAGWACCGYTGQGRFLLNCGIGDLLQNASVAERAMALRLVNEHEMGELFKVIAFEPGGNRAETAPSWQPLGFRSGDRTHTL